MLIAVAAPMPFVVRPRLPLLTVMPPVKVLADDGFRTHVPPSFLITPKRLVPLFANTEVIMLLSVLAPRRSRFIVKAPVLLLVILLSTSGPLPEESMRWARVAVIADANTTGREAVSPAPT